MILLERKGLCTSRHVYIKIYFLEEAPGRDRGENLRKETWGTVGRCKQERVQKGGKRWGRRLKKESTEIFLEYRFGMWAGK